MSVAKPNICPKCRGPNRSPMKGGLCEDCQTFRNLPDIGVTFSAQQRSDARRHSPLTKSPSLGSDMDRLAAFLAGTKRK